MRTVAILFGLAFLVLSQTTPVAAEDWAKGVWQQNDGPDSCLFLRSDKPLRSTYVFQCRGLGGGALFLTDGDDLIGVIGEKELVGRFVVVAPVDDDEMAITVINRDGSRVSEQLYRRFD